MLPVLQPLCAITDGVTLNRIVHQVLVLVFVHGRRPEAVNRRQLILFKVPHVLVLASIKGLVLTIHVTRWIVGFAGIVQEQPYMGDRGTKLNIIIFHSCQFQLLAKYEEFKQIKAIIFYFLIFS